MKAILTIIAIAGTMTAGAQERHAWSLADCIGYALEHNITVKQRDITKQQRELDVNTAKNSRLPDLNATANQNWSFGRGLTSRTPTPTLTRGTPRSVCPRRCRCLREPEYRAPKS